MVPTCCRHSPAALVSRLPAEHPPSPRGSCILPALTSIASAWLLQVLDKHGDPQLTQYIEDMLQDQVWAGNFLHPTVCVLPSCGGGARAADAPLMHR